MINDYFAWVKKEYNLVAHESETGKAIDYSIIQKQYLRTFLKTDTFRWITTMRYTQYVFILTFYIKVHNLSIFLQKPKDNYSMYIIMKPSTKGGFHYE